MHEYEEEYGLSPTFVYYVLGKWKERFAEGQEAGERLARIRVASHLILRGYEDDYISKLTQVTAKDLARCREKIDVDGKMEIEKFALALIKEDSSNNHIAKVTDFDIEIIKQILKGSN